ncbi:hypothetical protein ACFQ36_17685 [Arthrobacter sp. GCM10027362]
MSPAAAFYRQGDRATANLPNVESARTRDGFDVDEPAGEPWDEDDLDAM